MEAISIQAIDRRIRELGADITREKNKKENARLVDDQASLKGTLRLMRSDVINVQRVKA